MNKKIITFSFTCFIITMIVLYSINCVSLKQLSENPTFANSPTPLIMNKKINSTSIKSKKSSVTKQEINNKTKNDSLSKHIIKKEQTKFEDKEYVKSKHNQFEPYKPDEPIPKEFVRSKYEKEAEKLKEKIFKKLEICKELEKKNGVTKEVHPNGDKNLVEVYDEEGNIIGMLNYLSNEWIHQLVEYKNGKPEGYVVTFIQDGTIQEIYECRNGKFNGPFMQFEVKGKNKGALIYYVELKDNHYYGLHLGWTPEGIPLKGCKRYNKPKIMSLYDKNEKQ